MFGSVFAWIGKWVEVFRTIGNQEGPIGLTSVRNGTMFGVSVLALIAVYVSFEISDRRAKKSLSCMSKWRMFHMAGLVYSTALLAMALKEHSVLASWTMSFMQGQQANFYNYADWPFLMKVTAWSIPVYVGMSVIFDGIRRRKPHLVLLTFVEILLGVLLAPALMLFQIIMSLTNYILSFKVWVYGWPYMLFALAFMGCVKSFADETPEEMAERLVRQSEERRARAAAIARQREIEEEEYRRKAEERRRLAVNMERLRQESAEREQRRRAAEEAERRRAAAERERRRKEAEQPQFTMLVEDKKDEPSVPAFTMLVEDEDN